MSWMPSNDPVLGDPLSCDALELVIVPRTRDLGDGFEVRRALPHGKPGDRARRHEPDDGRQRHRPLRAHTRP